jgi:hypothetical protein
MKKADAVSVLHEISAVIKDSVALHSVSLDDSTKLQASSGYRIKIRCELECKTRESIKNIADKHGLFLIEENGFLILYFPR